MVCKRCFSRMPFASFANYKPACAGMEVLAKSHDEPDQYKIASRAIMDLKNPFL